MNCGMECVKYLLFIFNFIFALGGLAILVVGVLIHHSLFNVTNADINVEPLSLPASVLIAIGAIIFIIAFFGCCGAIRENHCMIVTFAVLLLTLLIVQVAVASYAFIKIKGEDLKKPIEDELHKAFRRYYEGKTYQDAVNTVQTITQCCGYNSYRDFVDDPKNTDQSIPYSCCKKGEGQTCSQSESFKDGCKDKFVDLLKYYANALGGLALGIAAVELIGIIFSFCLANSIRNVERRGYKV